MNKRQRSHGTVLITGGTGSLGRALVRNIRQQSKDRIVVFSRDEGKHALYFKEPYATECVIGDVRDEQRLTSTLLKIKPNVVIHAAALKRIDDLENCPDECIKTNVNGSQNVINSCVAARVAKCVLVSTDKACMPINVYGASKFMAERLFLNANEQSSTLFSVVRYGNVIASRGSFIPLWLNLISRGKKIPITSRECTRFMFKLSDAISLIHSALSETLGGDIFVPTMKSYSMKTVIEALAKLENKKIDDDMIDVIGMRPGEKLHEDMVSEHELHRTKVSPHGYAIIEPQIIKGYRQCRSIDMWQLAKPINSSSELSDNSDDLARLIADGIKDDNHD